jgi:HK97 family phage portal protein
MSFLSRLFRRSAPGPEQRGAFGFTGGFISPPGTGFSHVNPFVAENLSTVAACVGAVSSALASMPAYVYRQEDRGRSEASNHPVARLLRRPNEWQSWPDWLEWTVSQVLLWGNALSMIEYDGAGRPTALLPIPWQNVQVFLLPSGSIAYDVVRYIAPWGGTGQPRRLLNGEVFHLKDRSDDGILGRSRLSRAPEVLSAALNIQQFATAVWNNSAAPLGVLSVPGKLSKEVAERISTSFADTYGGSANARKTAVLEEGLTWTPVSVSPEDAELLASRRFTVEELCRLYQVPPPIVQDYTHGTFTNAAQAGLWFAQLSLTPWARKIEAEFSRSVFTDDDFHLEIDLSGLMRGDYAARWAAYGAAVANKILTVDEIREAEGYNPMAKASSEAGPQVDV